MLTTGWHGTIAILGTPNRNGKTLPTDGTTWLPLDTPITINHLQHAVGTIEHMRLDTDSIYAEGNISDGALLGELRRGKHLPVSPNIRIQWADWLSKDRYIITGITIMKTPSWPGAYITQHLKERP